MLTLLRQFWHDLLYSPEKVTLWIRSVWFGFWQGVAVAVAQGAFASIPKGWAIVASVLSAAALAAKAGDKNPTT